VLDWLILVPLAMTVLLNLPSSDFIRRQAAVLVALLAAAQAALVAAAPEAWFSGASILGNTLHLHLAMTGLSRVMLLCIGLAMLAAACVTQATFKDDFRRRANFVSLLLVSLLGMNGAVLVTDIFSLYVFIEVTSVSSFVLIAFPLEKKSLEGAIKYLILSAVATVLMLGSMALLLMVAGSMDFAGVKAALVDSHEALLAKLAMGAFVCGLLIKGGLVPFHGWVMGAYSASPSPTSVLLAGIVTKVCGIYAMIRLASTVFPPNMAINQVLMLVGAVSIVVGAVLALRQTDMKRLLAYSSISQVGYIVLGLGCATPLAWAGAIFHLFNHTVFKSLLFVNSAAVERRAGTTDMMRLGQLGSRMPLTNLTSVIATLSTAGVPPLAGFWSKLLIIVALWQAGVANGQAMYFVYAAVAVLFSVVTLGYLLSLQRKVFFGKAAENLELPGKPSGWMSAPELILAAVTVAAGLLAPLLLLARNYFLMPMGGSF
jgi:proton-translocating NADH-quinone oxidoreductase chain N